MKKLKVMSTLMVVVFSLLFTVGCSDNDANLTTYNVYAENLSATVVDNEKGVSTESYFAALNKKLQETFGGNYSDADALKNKLTQTADQTIASFEQNDMQNVYFYGRFNVGYQAQNSTAKQTFKEYSNPTLNKATLLKVLSNVAAANPDGFTVNASTLETVNKGYSVALEATQNSFGEEGLVKVIDYVLSHDDVNAYGGWLDTESNQYYYDATVICTDREEAIKLGKENHQIAIFDLENLEEIRLEY